MASLSQGRTAAAQCDLFTHKSVPVIFEPPCTTSYAQRAVKKFRLYILLSPISAPFLQCSCTAQSVQGSNPCGGENFCARPDRPCVSPNLLYNGHRVFSGGKVTSLFGHPPPPSAEVKERVVLYTHSPFVPYGTS